MVPSIPVPIIAPPNSMADSTRYIVGSIPSTPPVSTSGSSISLPVDREVLVSNILSELVTAGMIPSPPASSEAICGWNIHIPTSPAAEPAANVSVVPARRHIMAMVMAGITSTHGVMLNVELMACIISSAWLDAVRSLL